MSAIKMEYYNDKMLESTLVLLRDQLNDLSKWSVYNGDKFNKEITEIEKLIDDMDSSSQPRCSKCGELIRDDDGALCGSCAS